MPNHFSNEVDGQLKFYQDYLPLVDKTLTTDDILSDYADGFVNGNLLEFKVIVNDINSVLFQAIKYLSARRIKGREIPRNILLISLTNQKVYVFSSEDYLADIEKVYFGGASLKNSGFSASNPIEILEYGESQLDESRMISLLRSKQYTKINIDENCIVGWAERFYRENKGAKKSDFIGDHTGKVKIIGEIRKPEKLKDFINPYIGETNAQFQYLMDKLNDTLQKKNLGAFYTPEPYVQKSLELVRQAIQRVPKGNDYIILDRCAGTGNLEKMMTDEELGHCVLSTIEYYEYKVLLELLGDKVRHIIPPTEKEDTFNMGLVRGADALSEEYLNNEVIKQYIDDPNTTIILYENPPYAETTSIEHQKTGAGKSSSTWKKSFLVNEMKKEVKGTTTNDLGNVFIWSAFKYYLKQPTDSYIVYSPVKYWKAQHLVNQKFLGGFAFNRKHFHTNIDAMIMCALWSKEESSQELLTLEAFNIDKEGKLLPENEVLVKRIFSTYSQCYFDKRPFPDDKNNGLYLGLNGREYEGKTKRITPLFNSNILGYMAVYSSGFDNPDLHSTLIRAGRYDGNGFFLRSDNFLEKLPMFAASRYITYNRHWTQRANIMKSADGAERFNKAIFTNKIEQELLKILLFTTLETQNHMRSLRGTDGRFYRNELSLDTSNGDTLATTKLIKLQQTPIETALFEQWEKVLREAKKTENYDAELTYSVYQIIDELNTSEKDENDKIIYHYPELNGHLNTLKTMVKEYYNSEIVPFLFKYEFLK
ncbi:TPA: hypothetical protein VBA43_000579 [Streptococcus agalactiae]|nr:hypothetical protein [Streptococcus agalactiae]HEO6625343.1 hypothetical protein [Streptococcus agalactiae]HEO6642360.1 hypothetical protein [Streptococcus agalactiae]